MAQWRGDVRRWLLAGVGVVCVALAALGAMLPGLPTTVFLIAASYCFARSCPWLEERLMRNRLFLPYLAWIEGREPMPRRAKAAAIASLWIAVTVSLALVHAASRLEPWLAITIVIAAILGTIAIAMDGAYRILASQRPASDSASR